MMDVSEIAPSPMHDGTDNNRRMTGGPQGKRYVGYRGMTKRNEKLIPIRANTAKKPEMH